MQQLQTARFWVYWAEGWVKLSIPPGDNIELRSFGKHEEGWSSHVERWSNDGKEVIWEVYNDGTDCDGRHSSASEFVCPVEKLKSIPITKRIPVPGTLYEEIHVETGLFQPEWERTDSSVYDQYAQLSNY